MSFCQDRKEASGTFVIQCREIVKETGRTEEALDHLRGLFEPCELHQTFQ